MHYKTCPVLLVCLLVVASPLTLNCDAVPTTTDSTITGRSNMTTVPSTSSSASSIKKIASLTTKTARVVPILDRKVVCYLGSWAWYRPGAGKFNIEDIDATLCTHAIYSFALLENNKIVYADSWYDIDNKAYERFVDLKKYNPDLKTTIAIGGWNEGSVKYSLMAASKSTRTTFIESVVKFIKTYEFDGLDLDWEYPTQRGGQPEDRENFALLVTELREEFDQHGWILSAAIGVGTNVLEAAYDFSILCRELDFINLMTYDLHGSWDGVTGHHTSMYPHPNLGDIAYSVTQALDLIISLGGCPNKMILGMGMYGKSYTLEDPSRTDIGSPTKGDGTKGPYTGQNGLLGYNEICIGTNYQTDIDNYTMAPWAYHGDQWVCYDDVDSINTKCLWALERGLAGGMIWSLETDDFRGDCGSSKYPLLSKIYEIMKPDVTITTSTSAITTTKTPNPTTTSQLPTEPTSMTDTGNLRTPSVVLISIPILLGIIFRRWYI